MLVRQLDYFLREMGLKLGWENKNLFLVFLLTTLALISILFIMKNNASKINIPIFESSFLPIIVNLETPKTNENKVALSFDNKIVKFDNLPNGLSNSLSNNIFLRENSDLNTPISKAQLLIQKDAYGQVLKDIENLSVFIGFDFYYFNKEDINSWDKSEINLCLDKKCDKNGKTTFLALSFPQNIKKNGDFLNYRGNLHLCTTAFLSLFYTWQLYIIPYLLLFIAFIIYSRNKDQFEFFKKFKFKKAETVALLACLLLAFLIRLTSCDFIPLWPDELYAVGIASNPLNPFINTFLDPGNPPAFFILAKIWFMMFGVTLSATRLLPVLLGTGSIFTLYVLLKKYFNFKIAILGAFLMTINMINIFYSQEVRGYILTILLAPLAILFFMSLIKNLSLKNSLNYGLVASILVNNHYYCILLIFCNFVYGVGYLYKNSVNKIKDILSFLLLHVTIALTFLPYLIISLNNKRVLDKDFNSWILDWSPERFINIFYQYFGNIFIVLFVLLTLFAIANNRKNKNSVFNKILGPVDQNCYEMIVYCIYIIAAIFALASIISIFRPIFVMHYFTILVPFIVTIETLIISLPWKIRYKEILIIFLIFVFTVISGNLAIYQNQSKKMMTMDPILNYIEKDSPKFNKTHEVYAMVTDYKEYLNFYKKDFPAISDINWIILMTNSRKTSLGKVILDNIKNDNKPKILYLDWYAQNAFFSKAFKKPAFKDWKVSAISKPGGFLLFKLTREY